MAKVIINKTIYRPLSAVERPVIEFSEHNIYDSAGRTGKVAGWHSWLPIVINGENDMADAIIKNSGGDMRIEYSDCYFEFSGCYLQTDSDTDNNILNVFFKHALMKEY